MVSCVTQRLGGSGGMPPQEILNFRRSEIDSGEFWDAFPAWQGTHTNRGKLQSAHAERSIDIRES